MVNSKYIAGVIVLSIISFLIISGPANAFITILTSSKTIVNQKDNIMFNATMNLEEGEHINNIDYLSFKLIQLNNNTEEINKEFLCNFKANGDIINGCKDMKIEVLNLGGYGYCDSYGYNNECNKKFIITLNTKNYDLGEYETYFIINLKTGSVETTKGNNFIITLEPDDKVCSVRAKKGTVIVENKEFKNSRINFYIPYKKASEGGGYITGQSRRERFSYKFNVEKILENNNMRIKAIVSGTYRLGTKDNVFEKATLNFDKINNTITVIGNKINFFNGEIYFRQGC